MQDIEIYERLRYPEQPEKTLDHKIKKLRNKQVMLVKVQWHHKKGSDITQEPEVDITDKYPYVFS